MNYDSYEDLRNNYSLHRDVKSELLFSRGEDIPQITIAIPTFNRPDYLLKALKSVKKQKTIAKYEVVVVDNNPETKLDLINEFAKVGIQNFKYYKNEKNIGMFGNWNRCIELASSDWITVLNDDDELGEGYMNSMIDAINTHSSGAFLCEFDYMDEDGAVVFSPSRIGKIFNSLKREKIVSLCVKDFYFRYPIKIYGTVFDREKLLEIGGFDERFYPCSDEVLLFNVCKKYGALKLEKKIFRYRWAVNESQRLDTRIKFITFVNDFQRYINSRYSIVNSKYDSWLRNAIADNTIEDLCGEKDVELSDCKIKEIKMSRGLKFECRRHKLCSFILKAYKCSVVFFRKCTNEW